MIKTYTLFLEYGLNPKASSLNLDVCLPFAVVPMGSASPFFIAFAGQWADYDCFYYILEEFLSDAAYRDSSTIWCALVFRFLANLVSGLETCRVGLQIIACMAIAIDRGYTIIKILLKHVKNSSKFYQYYIMSSILIKKVEVFVTLLLYIVMNIGFWATVISSWATVRLKVADVTLAVYVPFVCMLVALIITHIVCLPILCVSFTMAKYVVKYHYLRANMVYTKSKSYNSKYFLKKIRGIMPIRIKYGWFWEVDEEFLGEYLMLIVLRVFDAIMLDVK